MVVLALLASLVALPASNVIAADWTSGFGSGSSLLDGNSSLLDDKAADYEVVMETKSCSVAIAGKKNVEITSGDDVVITWETEGYTDIKLNGETLNGASGQITISNVQVDTTYTLVATDGQNSTCDSQVTVICLPPDTPEFCELDVHKSVDKHTAKVGDTLTYTITVKNEGDADCTGGGVKIFDVIDDRLDYDSYSLSGDVNAGYGNQSVYNSGDRTLRFNGNTLTPGESVTITWSGLVTAPHQCGDFVVKNQAKATAKELNNFGTWVYSPEVKTDIDNDCDVPEAPACPLQAKDGRTIVEFNGLKLRSDQGIDRAQTVTVNQALTAGNYDITLVSWDGYIGRENTSQPNEKWELEFMNNGSVVGTSNAIGDLQDNVRQVTKTQQVNNNFNLAQGATGLRAAHAVYPDGSSPNSLFPICAAIDEIPAEPVPSCDMFTAAPATIMAGDTATLSWETTNATRVAINNNIGEVAADGNIEVTPLDDITYTLSVFGPNSELKDTCITEVKVQEDSVPVCKYFTATPNQLGAGGGTVDLAWRVTDAQTVSISPNIGSVAASSSRSVSVTQSTNFVLTAEDDNGDKISCEAPVAVADQAPFSCANNVTFSASDRSIDRGDDTTLAWSTTDVDSVSITDLGSVGLSGSDQVSPSSDRTYTLTATRGNESVQCPLTIDVSSGGGGGGGSATPRCELEISEERISRGEEIEIEWETSNARAVHLEDDRGNVLFTTDDYLSDEKEDYYDGSITLRPTRDTVYTLTAERGSRDRECEVEVEIDGEELTVIETREQQPLVSGISLSQTPYTGFEAGPVLTTLFYILLAAWSLFVTYLIVLRNQVTPGVAAATAAAAPTKGEVAMKKAEAARPDLFTPSMTASAATAPANLPTAAKTTEAAEVAEAEVAATDTAVLALENRAHAQKALLSSDAIRYFISTVDGEVERNETLDSVIAEAKANYPLEDNWIVINEARMRQLCESCLGQAAVSSDAPYTPAVMPKGSSSLAEAIVTGNIVAAYEMIGNRPMFSLADAAADLDAVYRSRKGESVQISDLLQKETAKLSDIQIHNMIAALTGALDGTYTDEASAVKMAIMKAVKEVEA